MALDRRRARAVDVTIGDGVVATLKWVSPGWQVFTVRGPDTDVPLVTSEAVFPTISEALDYLREAESGYRLRTDEDS